jgi:Pyridine nucleotide-disulphide oxidoreductase
VTTGPFQVPFVPLAAQRLDGSVTQLHSAEYRNPDALPAGPVLVVGGGNSGFQIAEELAATGRQVDLSIATRLPMLPQRLAGKDLFWWLTRLGLLRVSVKSRLGRRMSSRDFIIGGSRRRLRAAGVRLRPGVTRADGRTVRFADDTTLDAGIVIWATGYRADYSWIDIPGVIGDGKVIHRRGATEVPACTSWACPGSTPAARRCSASSTTTPPTSPGSSPPEPRHPSLLPPSPPPRGRREPSRSPRPDQTPCSTRNPTSGWCSGCARYTPPPPGQPASAPGPSTCPPRESSTGKMPPPAGPGPKNWNAAAPVTPNSRWQNTER